MSLSQRVRGVLLCIGLAAIALVAFSLTAAPSVTWSRGSSDSGDLAAAVASGGIAHSPGYPLFVILGHGVTRVVPVEAARVVTAIDALLIAGSLAIAGWTALQIASARRLVDQFIALGAAVLVGSSPLVWNLATFPNAHALNVLFASLTALGVTIGPDAAGASRRREFTCGLLIGAAISHHLTLAALVIALPPPRRLLTWAAGAIVGLSPWLLLPILAAQGPAHAWGDVTTVLGWFDHVAARDYHAYFGSQGIIDVLIRVVEGARTLIVSGVGPIGAVLVGVAMASWRGTIPALFWRWLVMTLVIVAFYGLYAARDVEAYLATSAIMVVPFVAIGFRTLAAWPGGAMIATAMGLLMVGQAAIQFPRMDRRLDTEARDFATETLLTAPASAILMTDRDSDTFALWYGQIGLGLRTELTVVDRSLWSREWYRRRILPNHASVLDDPLRAAESTGRPIVIVDSGVIDRHTRS